jgi:hypothetical protein
VFFETLKCEVPSVNKLQQKNTKGSYKEAAHIHVGWCVKLPERLTVNHIVFNGSAKKKLYTAAADHVQNGN